MHIGPSDISIAKDASCFIFLCEVAYRLQDAEVATEGPFFRVAEDNTYSLFLQILEIIDVLFRKLWLFYSEDCGLFVPDKNIHFL